MAAIPVTGGTHRGDLASGERVLCASIVALRDGRNPDPAQLDGVPTWTQYVDAPAP